MPVCAAKVGDRWRVVECATGNVAKNASGTAVDGGGFKTQGQARAQVSAINASKVRRHRGEK